MQVKMSLGDLRKMRGFTQEEAAERIGISKDTLSKYERGLSYPDVPVIRKIEEVYNTHYDNIIFLPFDYGLTVANGEEKQ